MSLPGNGIYVVRGEMATLMTAMRRGTRWNATAYVVSAPHPHRNKSQDLLQHATTNFRMMKRTPC